MPEGTQSNKPIDFTVGATEGQYFTPWRFDELKDLAKIIAPRLSVYNFGLHYESRGDFHHLTFEYAGRKIDVRLYKVFAYTIDGVDAKVTSLRSDAFDFVYYMVRRLGAA